jgi:hypothetical protein
LSMRPYTQSSGFRLNPSVSGCLAGAAGIGDGTTAIRE